jgi:hypothetical protein
MFRSFTIIIRSFKQQNVPKSITNMRDAMDPLLITLS